MSAFDRNISRIYNKNAMVADMYGYGLNGGDDNMGVERAYEREVLDTVSRGSGVHRKKRKRGGVIAQRGRQMGYPGRYPGSFPMPGFYPPLMDYEKMSSPDHFYHAPLQSGGDFYSSMAGNGKAGAINDVKVEGSPYGYGSYGHGLVDGDGLSGASGFRKKKKSVDGRKTRPLSDWQKRLKEYMSSHPGSSLKTAMVALKGT